MSQFSPAIRLLRRFGLSPQKVLLVLSDLLALLGTAIAVFLLRAAFDNLDSILYRWVLPLLLLGPLLGASLGLYQSISQMCIRDSSWRASARAAARAIPK